MTPSTPLTYWYTSYLPSFLPLHFKRSKRQQILHFSLRGRGEQKEEARQLPGYYRMYVLASFPLILFSSHSTVSTTPPLHHSMPCCCITPCLHHTLPASCPCCRVSSTLGRSGTPSAAYGGHHVANAHWTDASLLAGCYCYSTHVTPPPRFPAFPRRAAPIRVASH